MRKYNILVFPCGTEIANEIINSLHEHKYFKLIFASSEKLSYCNFIGKNINYLPYVTDNNFLNALNNLIKEKNIDFIIPAHDDVCYELSKLENVINCKIIGQSFNVNKIVRFKDKTYDFFKDKLPIPKIFSNTPNENEFPVFVKPKKGQGSINVKTLNNYNEYLHFFKLNEIQDYVVMEKLTGTEYTIDCFSDNGKLLYFGARTREKTMKGITVVSSFVDDEKLNIKFKQYAEIISSSLKMDGIWFYQMKLDRNNNLKLLEIGPRVAGSMALNRIRGINFVELALYKKIGYSVKVQVNSINNIKMGRALTFKFDVDIEYDNLYIDFDDTLYIDESKINAELMKIIFQAKNNNKKIYLITKNKKNNLTYVLHKYGITHIFDEIIHLSEKDKKTDYMKKRSVLIDDSFEERIQAINNGHFAFGLDNFSVLDL